MRIDESNDIFTGPGFLDPVTTYVSETTAGQLEITSVPAPGAVALLAAAGLVSRRGRRRDRADASRARTD